MAWLFIFICFNIRYCDVFNIFLCRNFFLGRILSSNRLKLTLIIRIDSRLLSLSVCLSCSVR